ncbi:HDOD domain-containing protein [candidate division KSB1 bacterium]
MDTIEQIKERVIDIPAISSNTLKILDLIANLDYSIKDLSDLIALDVSLSTKCLKIVNSAKFALRSEITSIERAVSYLGKQAIFGLVVENSFGSVFNSPLEGYNAGEGELWEHSLKTAISSRLIALETKKENIADLAYTSGLLHNMGKVIITDFLKTHNKSIKDSFNEFKDIDFSNIEKEFLSISHADVGKMMAEKWGIPESIQNVILYHHNPKNAPDEFRILCYIVHFGDHLAMLSGGSSSFDSLAYKVDPKSKDLLKLEDEAIDSLMFEIELEFIEAKDKIFGNSQ